MRELAEDRAAAETRFRLGLRVARAAGASISEIASAAQLSTSRVNAILERQGKAPRVLANEEIDYILENDLTVGIVPAGRIALNDYANYRAYICQPYRAFKHEMDRLGFYAHREVSPHFPKIRKIWPAVPFTAEEATRRRSSPDPLDAEVADIIERVLATPSRGGHRSGAHKVFLLTAPEDPETITLAHPIKHLVRGRGQAFVQKQRYTSEAAVRREPKTTAELLKYERA